MSVAIIIQEENNTINGGSLQGFQNAASDGVSAADTFYGRRLTNMLVNTGAVNSFTASTGGGGSASTAGQFTLVPGTYRIDMTAIYNCGGTAGNVIWGLYNVTSSAFEVYTGGAEPILGTSWNSTVSANEEAQLMAVFTVSTTNKTYEIRHKASNTTVGRRATFGGAPTSMAGANVNSAAAKNLYFIATILKSA